MNQKVSNEELLEFLFNNTFLKTNEAYEVIEALNKEFIIIKK